MLTILIVDDENWIRKGIAAKVAGYPKQDFNLRYGKNGQEALSIIKNEKVDIVITDIQMPVMDGLDLIEAMVEDPKMRGISVIIVSGYAEFQYAKKAIGFGVNGYLLKPVKKDELYTELECCIDNIQQKKIKEPSVYGKDLNYWLRGERKDKRPSYQFYQLMMIHHKLQVNNNESKDLILQLLQDQIQKSLNQSIEWVISDNYKSGRQILVLMMGDDHAAIQQAVNRIEVDFYKLSVKAQGVAIGLSDIKTSISALIYQEATENLTHRLIYGYGKVYRTGQFNTPTSQGLDERIQLIKQYVDQGRIKSVKQMIAEIFTAKNFSNHQFLEQYWIEIISLLDIKAALKSGDELLNKDVLNKFDDMEDLRTYLCSKTEALIFNTYNNDDVEGLVTKVLNYVNGHYYEELMVKAVAIKFSVNANYLSGLFKKETGRSFTRYLTELRMDNACRLLMDTEGSVSEIASSVGYQDPQYFYRVFKKQVGITPLKFRQNQKTLS